MPTELGPPFPVDYPRVPTHMSTLDYSIWERYRRELPAGTHTLYFDVRLGGGRSPGDETDPKYVEFWMRNTQKRADVLAVAPSGIWIIELRDQAQSNAIGRLLLYGKLWLQDAALGGPVKLLLVTNVLDPDVRDLADAMGIEYKVV